MKAVQVVSLALAIMMPPFALAELILVEDNRFVETSVDGAMNRDEPPGLLSWEWSAELPQYPVVSQETTFAGTTLSASGGAFITLDGGISQEAQSTFEVLFRVDRATFISLSGQFMEYATDYAGRLLFMEDSAVLLDELSLTEPDPPYTRPLSFALDRILVPDATYRLLVKAAVREDSPTGGTDVYQNWAFTLEVPELAAVALLPLVLLAAGLSRRGPPR